jgi:hypothetical protein
LGGYGSDTTREKKTKVIFILQGAHKRALPTHTAQAPHLQPLSEAVVPQDPPCSASLLVFETAHAMLIEQKVSRLKLAPKVARAAAQLPP